MPDTLWTFARLKFTVAGATALRTTRRVRHRWSNGSERAYDNEGVPRGLNDGEYTGSTEVEVSTQEFKQIYDAMPEGGGDMENLVSVVSNWSPKRGSAGKVEAQGYVNEGEIVDEPNSESMTTITVEHLVPLKIDGKSVREAIGGASGGGPGVSGVSPSGAPFGL